MERIPERDDDPEADRPQSVAHYQAASATIQRLQAERDTLKSELEKITRRAEDFRRIANENAELWHAAEDSLLSAVKRNDETGQHLQVSQQAHAATRAELIHYREAIREAVLAIFNDDKVQAYKLLEGLLE